jgi:hypothetical protein
MSVAGCRLMLAAKRPSSIDRAASVHFSLLIAQSRLSPCGRSGRSPIPRSKNRGSNRAIEVAWRMPAQWGPVTAQRRLDPGSFPCSSRHSPKLSPPFSGPRNSPTAASIRAFGLGVRLQNVPEKRSPNGLFSPKLGAWPIYSTSFFDISFSGLASFVSRKVGVPFARCL